MKMETERYFVSYNYQSEGRYGFGNLETVMSVKITDCKVVKLIQKDIEKKHGFSEGSVIILNFQRFDS